MTDTPKHPAKFSPAIVAVLRVLVRRHAETIERRPRLLDPFAGVGTIHQLGDIADTQGVELRPRWAANHPRTKVGDATRLPSRWTGAFDIVATSPCYGNRLADHHNAADTCKRCKGVGSLDVALEQVCDRCRGTGLSVRRSYAHDYGEPFEHPRDGAVLRFGSQSYEQLHAKAYRQVRRVLADDGVFLLNVSDFLREKQTVPAVSWHIAAAVDAGFRLRRRVPVTTRRLRFGANRDARAAHEVVLVLRKGT